MSIFSQALKSILDDTGLFDRKQWATFLQVSPLELDKWVSDQAIPKAETLKMMWGVLDESDRIPSGPMKIFLQMAKMPAKEVSIFGEQMQPNVFHYLHRPIIEGMLRMTEVKYHSQT